MAKKGGSRHFVRVRAAKRLGVVSRKKLKWLLSPSAGPHPKEQSVSAGVLLRDILGRAKNLREAKRILQSGNLLVDGKKITDPKFPIGLMDIVCEPAEGKTYRMSLSGERLVPVEVKGDAASSKYLKVTGKRTIRGGKTQISFHDGRTYLGDKNIMTGDTCVFSIPDFKMASHLKFAPGCLCLVTEGRHRGELARLEKMIERPGSHDAEALLKGSAGEFVTVAKYLFVVDDKFM
ncbi:MAG: S4 domain-containing protein [Candidatus Micrarchaeota archaeon]|nr:S4 domain-containing protein [Candidatus Micrarchaeota archaeon]